MTNLFRQGVLASLRPRGEAEGDWPDRRAEVTVKATYGAHHVVEDGMFGRQSGASGETWRRCAKPSGVRALIVLTSSPGDRGRQRDGQQKKPSVGKGGRKVEARG